MGNGAALNNDHAAQECVKFRTKASLTHSNYTTRRFYLARRELRRRPRSTHRPPTCWLSKTQLYTKSKARLYYHPVLPHSSGLSHDERVLPAFIWYWNNPFGLWPFTHQEQKSTISTQLADTMHISANIWPLHHRAVRPRLCHWTPGTAPSLRPF